MTFLRLYLFSIIVILVTTKVYSQDFSIKGRVLDKNSQPMVGANVTTEGISNGTVTNILGEFELNNIHVDKVSVRISYTGYTTLLLELESGIDTVYTVYLEETAYDLNRVVITATRTEKILKDVPVLTQVISPANLQEVHTNTIQDALETYVPSISFTRAGFGTRMNMFGLDAKYSLFLIDGERMAGETNGNIDYMRFNINNIERIEVIRGAASTLYGSNAIGGVLNVITKELEYPFELSVSSKLSKFNDLNTFANAGFKLKKFSSKTEFGYSSTDGYGTTSLSLGGKKLNPYKNYIINQKFKYTVSERLKFESRTGYYSQERFYEKDPRPIHPRYYDFNNLVKAVYTVSKQERIEASWYYDKYRTVDVLENLDNKERLTYADQINNFRLMGHFRILDSQMLTMGTELLDESLFSERVNGENKDVQDLILFVQDDIMLTSNLNSVLGIRLINNTVYGFHATPQVSVMYKFSNWRLRGSYSAGYRSPTLKELYMNFSPVSVVEIYGNENLKPEKSHYFSGSVEYTGSGLNASASIYHSSIDNMITEINDLNDMVRWTYMNVNSATIDGLEFTLNKKLGYGFMLNGLYNYTNTVDDATDKQVWGEYKGSGYINIGYNLNRVNYKLSVGVYLKYIGETFYHEVDELTGVKTDRYIPEHILGRISTNQVFWNGISLTLGVDNILDFSDLDHYIGMNPGRRFFVGLNVDLHKLNIINNF